MKTADEMIQISKSSKNEEQIKLNAEKILRKIEKLMQKTAARGEGVRSIQYQFYTGDVSEKVLQILSDNGYDIRNISGVHSQEIPHKGTYWTYKISW